MNERLLLAFLLFSLLACKDDDFTLTTDTHFGTHHEQAVNGRAAIYFEEPMDTLVTLLLEYDLTEELDVVLLMYNIPPESGTFRILPRPFNRGGANPSDTLWMSGNLSDIDQGVGFFTVLNDSSSNEVVIESVENGIVKGRLYAETQSAVLLPALESILPNPMRVEYEFEVLLD